MISTSKTGELYERTETHLEQLPGEVFFGNGTAKQFALLPFSAKDPQEKRMGQMAFDEHDDLIHKGGQLPDRWVYPVFVLKSAVEGTKHVRTGASA